LKHRQPDTAAGVRKSWLYNVEFLGIDVKLNGSATDDKKRCRNCCGANRGCSHSPQE
jgi:hypothetical protein